MATNKMHVGDTGTRLTFDIYDSDGNKLHGADISSASLHVTKADGSTATWSCSIEGDSVVYYTQADDLDVAGNIHFQLHVTLMSGWSGKSNIVHDVVYY